MPTARDCPCSVCGSLLWTGTHSRPPAERVCRACRRAHRLEVRATSRSYRDRDVLCAGCGSTFATDVPTKTYCSAACRQRAKRRRQAERRGPTEPAPRPPTTSCIDCGDRIRQEPLGRPPQRCPACRAHRASSRALERRRQEHAAALALTSDPPPWWFRLLNRRRSSP